MVVHFYHSAGFRYGKSLIPISSADEEAMKLKAEKCLSVLGFTKTDKVKNYNITLVADVCAYVLCYFTP